MIAVEESETAKREIVLPPTARADKWTVAVA